MKNLFKLKDLFRKKRGSATVEHLQPLKKEELDALVYKRYLKYRRENPQRDQGGLPKFWKELSGREKMKWLEENMKEKLVNEYFEDGS